jgi:hypothetical protein
MRLWGRDRRPGHQPVDCSHRAARAARRSLLELFDLLFELFQATEDRRRVALMHLPLPAIRAIVCSFFIIKCTRNGAANPVLFGEGQKVKTATSERDERARTIDQADEGNLMRSAGSQRVSGAQGLKPLAIDRCPVGARKELRSGRAP